MMRVDFKLFILIFLILFKASISPAAMTCDSIFKAAPKDSLARSFEAQPFDSNFDQQISQYTGSLKSLTSLLSSYVQNRSKNPQMQDPLFLTLASKEVPDLDPNHVYLNLPLSERESFRQSLYSILIPFSQFIRERNKSLSPQQLQIATELLSFAIETNTTALTPNERVKLGKLFFSFYNNENISLDLILKTIEKTHYTLNAYESKTLAEELLFDWHNNPHNRSYFSSFSRLTKSVSELPSELVHKFAQFGVSLMDSKSPMKNRYHYSHFLLALLHISPKEALWFTEHTEHRMQTSDINFQLNLDSLTFAQNYFRFVMQKPVLWLEASSKRIKSEKLKQGGWVPLPDTITPSQKNLYQALKAVYPKAQLEYNLPDTRIDVDIYIPEKHTVIEVDGSIHLRYKEDLTLATQYHDLRRDEIIQALGYKVTRVSNSEAHKLADGLKRRR